MFLESTPGSGGSDVGDILALCVTAELGLGVELLKAVAAGTVLDRFTGEISPEITQHSLQVGPEQHISGTRFVGYLSHGCEPNCRLDMDRFELVALRDIGAGELLTIDYAATEDRLHVQFPCHCGAQSCRGWITGRLEGINANGLGHMAAHAGR
jgi:uncharacterized protein